MISTRLAKELGLKKNEHSILISNPTFTSSAPFHVNTGNRPVMVEHELLPGGYSFIYPIIVDDLYWDVILGGDSMTSMLLPALLNPTMRMKPTEGPGYDENIAFMGMLSPTPSQPKLTHPFSILTYTILISHPFNLPMKK